SRSLREDSRRCRISRGSAKPITIRRRITDGSWKAGPAGGASRARSRQAERADLPRTGNSVRLESEDLVCLGVGESAFGAALTVALADEVTDGPVTDLA